MIAWCDGAFADAGAAAVGLDDDAVLSGRGVFETLRALDGTACWRDRHLARLVRSAAIVGIAPCLAIVEQGLDAVLPRAPRAARVRVTVTAGGRVIVTAGPLPEFAPARVMVSPFTRNERGPLVGTKTTSYADNAAVFRHAASLGFDEALLFNSKGLLCEGTRTNVVVELDGRLVTPPLGSGCLPGVVRGVLVEQGLVAEADVDAAGLARARSLCLTSALRVVQPVARLGDRALAPPPDVLLAVVRASAAQPPRER